MEKMSLQMHTRKLGRQGLEVSALGLGCMGMSDFYAGRDEAEALAIIPGTKKRSRLEENVGALAVRIGAEDLARIDRILPPGAAAGPRYDAPQMQALNR